MNYASVCDLGGGRINHLQRIFSEHALAEVPEVVFGTNQAGHQAYSLARRTLKASDGYSRFIGQSLQP